MKFTALSSSLFHTICKAVLKKRILSDLFSLNSVYVQLQSQFAEVYNRHFRIPISYLEKVIRDYPFCCSRSFKLHHRNFMHRCFSLKRAFPIVAINALPIKCSSTNKSNLPYCCFFHGHQEIYFTTQCFLLKRFCAWFYSVPSVTLPPLRLKYCNA